MHNISGIGNDLPTISQPQVFLPFLSPVIEKIEHKNGSKIASGLEI